MCLGNFIKKINPSFLKLILLKMFRSMMLTSKKITPKNTT